MTFSPKEVEALQSSKQKYLHSANTLFIILLRLQAFIFNCFFSKGLFLRGGISTQYCYIKDQFAVGEGLISAYKAESTIAKYPRIVFSPEVLADQKLRDSITSLSNAIYSGNQIIKQDEEDGVHYLDYLGHNLSTVDLHIPIIYDAFCRNSHRHYVNIEQTKQFFRAHAKAIESKLIDLEIKKNKLGTEEEKKKLEKVIDKFKWLKNYHNLSLSKYPKYAEFAIK